MTWISLDVPELSIAIDRLSTLTQTLQELQSRIGALCSTPGLGHVAPQTAGWSDQTGELVRDYLLLGLDLARRALQAQQDAALPSLVGSAGGVPVTVGASAWAASSDWLAPMIQPDLPAAWDGTSSWLGSSRDTSTGGQGVDFSGWLTSMPSVTGTGSAALAAARWSDKSAAEFSLPGGPTTSGAAQDYFNRNYTQALSLNTLRLAGFAASSVGLRTDDQEEQYHQLTNFFGLPFNGVTGQVIPSALFGGTAVT